MHEVMYDCSSTGSPHPSLVGQAARLHIDTQARGAAGSRFGTEPTTVVEDHPRTTITWHPMETTGNPDPIAPTSTGQYQERFQELGSSSSGEEDDDREDDRLSPAPDAETSLPHSLLHYHHQASDSHGFLQHT